MALMSRATEAWHLFALARHSGPARRLRILDPDDGRAVGAAGADGAARSASVQTAQRVGPAIGPLIGGLLASALGLRTTFLVSSCVYAVAFVMVSVMYVEPAKAAAPDRTEERVSFSNVLAFENFVLLMLVIFSLQVVDRSFGPVLLLHVTELGYTARAASLLVGGLFSVLALSGVAGFQLAAILLKRTTARAVIAAASLACGGSPRHVRAGRIGVAADRDDRRCSAWPLARRSRPPSPPPVRGPASCPWGRVRVSDRRIAHRLGGQSGPERADCRAQHSRRVSVGAAVLALLVLLVRRVMVERDLPVESAPVDEADVRVASIVVHGSPSRVANHAAGRSSDARAEAWSMCRERLVRAMKSHDRAVSSRTRRARRSGDRIRAPRRCRSVSRRARGTGRRRRCVGGPADAAGAAEARSGHLHRQRQARRRWPPPAPSSTWTS